MSSVARPSSKNSLHPSPEDMSSSIKLTCHCKCVEVVMPSRPKQLSECHCTVCYAYGALWAYFTRNMVTVTVKEGAKIHQYIRDDLECCGDLSFNRCSKCGCMTHWQGEGEYSDGDHEMGVNCRLLPEKEIEGIARKEDWNDA